MKRVKVKATRRDKNNDRIQINEFLLRIFRLDFLKANFNGAKENCYLLVGAFFSSSSSFFCTGSMPNIIFNDMLMINNEMLSKTLECLLLV